MYSVSDVGDARLFGTNSHSVIGILIKLNLLREHAIEWQNYSITTSLGISTWNTAIDEGYLDGKRYELEDHDF